MGRYVNEVEFIDLLIIIWKKKWLIIIPTFICVAVAAAISFMLSPIWEVNAIMLPSKFLVQTEQGRFEEVIVTDPKQIADQINQESYNMLLGAKLNMDIREFPNLKAENLRDSKLVRLSVREKDVKRGQRILTLLFKLIKEELDKKIEVEIKGVDTDIALKESSIKDNEVEIKDLENQINLKRLQINDEQNKIITKENEIKKKNNDIRIKNLDIQLREIDKERIKKEIEANENKLLISEDRAKNIMDEMKTVKVRIDEIDENLKKALAEKKQGGDAISLLLYSNEIQQNLRYYNTLDEKLSLEKITQENLRLSVRDKQEQLKQVDTQINQINTQIDSIETDVDNIRTEIAVVKTGIDKIKNGIEKIKNDIEKTNNAINTLQSEINLLADKKARIDYARLVKEPTPSIYPVSPKKKFNIIVTAVIGLAFFTFVAFLVEYIERNKDKRDKDTG